MKTIEVVFTNTLLSEKDVRKLKKYYYLIHDDTIQTNDMVIDNRYNKKLQVTNVINSSELVYNGHFLVTLTSKNIIHRNTPLKTEIDENIGSVENIEIPYMSANDKICPICGDRIIGKKAKKCSGRWDHDYEEWEEVVYDKHECNPKRLCINCKYAEIDHDKTDGNKIYYKCTNEQLIKQMQQSAVNTLKENGYNINMQLNIAPSMPYGLGVCKKWVINPDIANKVFK